MLLSLTSQYLILIILLQKQMFSFCISENKGHPDDFFYFNPAFNIKIHSAGQLVFINCASQGLFLNLQVNTQGN